MLTSVGTKNTKIGRQKGKVKCRNRQKQAFIFVTQIGIRGLYDVHILLNVSNDVIRETNFSLSILAKNSDCER